MVPILQDLHKPDANRLRRNLSGIINFAKFREEKLAPYTDMQEAAEHLLEETAQLEEQQLQLVGFWLDVLLEAVLRTELQQGASPGMTCVATVLARRSMATWMARALCCSAAVKQWGCTLACRISCVHVTSMLSKRGMLCAPAASRAAALA